MPSTHSSRSGSSSPTGSYSNNCDVTNSLNSTKILTVNNYFGSYPAGSSSTSHQDCPRDFFPPSRSSIAAAIDVSEESVETDAATSIESGEISRDASVVGVRRSVRFSEDPHPHPQEERPKINLAAYEYDMDAPGGNDASDTSSFVSQKSSVQTVESRPTKGPWKLAPVTVKGFNSSKSIPPNIRAYMRSDFFNDNQSIALWMPSPGISHNPELTKKNIAVGDVGVFTVQGSFEVFFNIFMTEEDNKEYGYKPPPKFSPCTTVMKDNIRKNPLRVKQYVRGDFRQVMHEEYVFSCETPCTRLRLEGSALVLPMGGWKFSFTLAMKTLVEDYLNVHAADWYKHYRSTPMLPSGSLKFVNTTYKSTTWAYAVGAKDVTTRERRLFAILSRPNKDEDIFDWKGHDDNVSVGAGPSAIEMDGPKATLINQCVAVEAFAIKPAAFIDTLNATLTRLSLYMSPK